MIQIDEFRYIACGGIEYRNEFSSIWLMMTGNIMLNLTAVQLRQVADAMEKKK